VAIALLLKANWKPTKWWDGARQVILMPGTLVTSRDSMCKTCRVSAKQFRNALSYLTKSGFCGTTRASRYTVVTITNWITYQSCDTGEGQERASKGPDEGQMRAKSAPQLKKERSKSPPSSKNQESGSELPTDFGSVGRETRDAKPNLNSLEVDDDDPPRRTEKGGKGYVLAVFKSKAGASMSELLARKLGEALEGRGATWETFADVVEQHVKGNWKNPAGLLTKLCGQIGAQLRPATVTDYEARGAAGEAPKCEKCGGAGFLDGDLMKACAACDTGQKWAASLKRKAEAA
jgi:hypothetical protein